MTLRLLIASSLLLLATPAIHAQSAADFFNGGAQFYISNSIPAALQKVETGLKIYPNDVKLKKLEELLKQQQQQQQQKQQNEQNQKNQQKQSQQNQNSQKQPSQSQQQQQQQQNQQNQQNQQKQPNPQNQQAQAMSPEEAKRLLDSQKDNEQVLQLKSKNQPENAIPPLKDW